MNSAAEHIAAGVLANLTYDATEEQIDLVASLSLFATSRDDRSVFLLSGYAGTGKTSITGALVRSLTSHGIKTLLLAPTGRAAKVFSEYSGHPAFTIHRKIYRKDSYAPDRSGFGIADNKHTDTVFIVDEASMIPNSSWEGAIFGTGRLLDDLIHYVYSGMGCVLILLGDNAQLPPVGFDNSPALCAEQLQGYGLTVKAFQLTHTARQSEESGILYNATELRREMFKDTLNPPQLDTASFPDFTTLSGEFLAERISDAYDSDGEQECIVITRSNKRASMFNLGIRNRILYREDELVPGDRLLVSKNNYFWSAEYKEIDFIANGDMATVVRVYGTESRYGFRFAHVSLEFADHGIELEAKILLDTLTTDAPALTVEQQRHLFELVMSELEGSRTERYRMLKNHPYFNALQVKYAYAVTCHKAQGGQWKNVFVDMGFIPEEALTRLDFYRWLYTAITRARKKVFLLK